jgi:hypothetical protein
MAWAGSDGPAKKSRNVDTSVARMTLKARATRLRMYVSKGYLPRSGHPWSVTALAREDGYVRSYWSSQTCVSSGMPLLGLFLTFFTLVPNTELPLSL